MDNTPEIGKSCECSSFFPQQPTRIEAGSIVFKCHCGGLKAFFPVNHSRWNGELLNREIELLKEENVELKTKILYIADIFAKIRLEDIQRFEPSFNMFHWETFKSLLSVESKTSIEEKANLNSLNESNDSLGDNENAKKDSNDSSAKSET